MRPILFQLKVFLSVLSMTALLPGISAQGVSAVPLGGQREGGLVVITPTEVQRRHDVYNQAFHDWDRNSDRTLVTDIGKVPLEVILPRIQKEADRTRKMMEAQVRYYEALASQYRNIYDRASGPGVTQLNRDEDKKTLQELSDTAFKQRQQLEAEIQGTTDLMIRGLLEKQRDALRRSEDALQNQRLAIDKIQEGEQGSSEKRARAMESMKKLIGVFEAATSGADNLRRGYDNYFESLTTGVKATPPSDLAAPPADNHKTDLSAPVASTPTASASVSVGTPANTANATGPGLKVAVLQGNSPINIDLSGVWMPPVGEDQQVELSLTEADGKITGTLTGASAKGPISFSGPKTPDPANKGFTVKLQGREDSVGIANVTPHGFELSIRGASGVDLDFIKKSDKR